MEEPWHPAVTGPGNVLASQCCKVTLLSLILVSPMRICKLEPQAQAQGDRYLCSLKQERATAGKTSGEQAGSGLALPLPLMNCDGG